MSLVQQVLDELGYRESPNFLRPGRHHTFDKAADFGHIFRRAHARCRLQGVYSLRDSSAKGRDTVVPVVYVCEAESEDDAERIHRLVWNQNVVPFLIVASQQSIRLYSGFRYETPRRNADPAVAGVIRAASDMKAALQFLDAFRSARIDDGTVWERWGNEVTPETRVDWKLLSSLSALDNWLRKEGQLDAHVSHALIGKYVYLNYLRQRDILSDRKLDKWGLKKKQIFGRTAQISSFWKVVEELNEWLNGSVFPLTSTGSGRPKQEHIRKVAGTFAGDEPTSGQLSLDFDAYDFSFIPIETLSVIYEQFLHSPDEEGDVTRGRTQGAYYTPLPLVNFMLEELDNLRPLKNGMKVLDPACGSGAFLVQCYRRIVERDEEFEAGKPMRPARLRELLEQHIFGIDRDEDACRVAELSLSLTLLDYVDPPDLERTPSFRLPGLHDKNIFQGDFFDPAARWHHELPVGNFDWMVGNPPWIELKRGKVSQDDGFAWDWMQKATNKRERPIGGNQVAEAFAWEVLQHLDDKGYVAMLLPAMTLFKDETEAFRQHFFASQRVHAVANFSNLAEVLFPGHRYHEDSRIRVSRPRRPAAAFFYSKTADRSPRKQVDVFSPFVADQPSVRPLAVGARRDTWNIVVDSNHVRSLDRSDLSKGEALPWKIAMWGSYLDLRVLNSAGSRFPSFDAFCVKNRLVVSQGIELRLRNATEPTEPVPEVDGESEVISSALKNRGLIFEFPPDALEKVPSERSFVRRGRRDLPLSVCRAPHIILDKVRRFAVYSDKFLVVPPRQIGIAGSLSQQAILKALSLYLVSDFAIYHQFLHSPEWGVSTSISTLDTLRMLPVPFAELNSHVISEWAEMHSRIVRAARKARGDQSLLFDADSEPKSGTLRELLSELNSAVFDLLQLTVEERFLVSDLVRIRMQMIQGKVTAEIAREATDDELMEYGNVLLNELDAFIDDQPEYWHSVAILKDGQSAIVGIALHSDAGRSRGKRVSIVAEDAMGMGLGEIRKRVHDKNSQWTYFRRNLRLYEGRNTYVFKPLERLHWTKSQALLDAGSIITETLI
jgi:methylase of polypeptide subunit release factors